MADGPVISCDTNEPQGRFLTLPHRFRAYVGGFGSGKTWVGSQGLCLAAWNTPGIPQAYFAPTYSQIRDIFYPTIEEVAERMGLDAKIKYDNSEVLLYEGRKQRSHIICRSMDHPERIVGFKIGRGLVDELDVMAAKKAQLAWRKIIARLRWDGPAGFKPNLDVTTTPEGFGFTYQQFVKAIRDNPQLAGTYGLVQASTYANEACLPEGYIESLLASYPPHLAQAYIDGKFVNLTSGTVYPQYDRAENRTWEKIEENEPIHIGMDFNVNNMSAIIHTLRKDNPYALDEITKVRDTPAMIEMIRARYWKYDHSRGDWNRDRIITIYPDASGGSAHSSDASKTDIALLKQAGFQVSAPAANPPVKDRINSMNGMFHSMDTRRRYLVNDEKCPTYADNLEQQVWTDAGEPDKSSSTDHTNDAGGYFIHRKFPIIKPVVLPSLRFAH